MKQKPGDLVEIELKDEKISGILMPSLKEDFVVVKLDNGYNIGISRKKIKSIKKKKGGKKLKVGYAQKLRHKKNLPTISILHTGGTIASKVDYSVGGVITSFKAEDLLGMFPELADIANIRTKLIAELMSEDMMFPHYKLMAKAVEEEIKQGVKGIIIGQGTDTLGYTAAALSFIFNNLPIPVILVGAQRSSDRGSSDAGSNLICAAKFIAKTDFRGVAICMHEGMDDESCLILPAVKTRKMHTSRRDAFKAVNTRPIARIDYKTGKITYLSKNYYMPEKGKLEIKDKFETKVGILRTYTNMNNDIFEFFNEKKYKGLVLESSGIGQAPTNIKENLPNYESLKKFIKKEGIVVLTSQCIFGRVHPNIYTNCRRLVDIGIIFAEDMLTETAYIKLAWLLGNYSKEEAKKLFSKNLRGEISERTERDTFLI